MHHCFFCHGLSRFFQVLPHRLVGQRLHQSQLHHPVRQQPQIPVAVALGRRRAGQGDQVGFLQVVQLPVPVRLDSVLQRPLQPVLGKAPLQAEHRALGHVQRFRHLGRRPPLVGLQQNAGPSGNPGGTLPSPDHML